MNAPRTREGLRLAVQLYASQPGDEMTGERVIEAADIFDHRLAQCPPEPSLAAEILASLAALHRKVDIMTAEQIQIDSDVAKLAGVLTTIQAAEAVNATAVAAVAAALAAAQQANPAADLSGLEALINGSADGTTPGLVAAAQSVTDGVAAVQGLVPGLPAAPVSGTAS